MKPMLAVRAGSGLAIAVAIAHDFPHFVADCDPVLVFIGIFSLIVCRTIAVFITI